MNYRVDLSNEAIKTLSRLDRPTESRVRARLRELAENPFNPRIGKLLRHAGGRRSSWAGDWRIIYTVDREQKVINVLAIRSRGQVYRRL